MSSVKEWRESFKRWTFFPRTKLDYWTFRKLRSRKSKETPNKDWAEWLKYQVRDVNLEPTLHERVQEGTYQNLLSLWMRNFAENLSNIRYGDYAQVAVPSDYHQQTIADLVQSTPILEGEPDFEKNTGAITEYKGVKIKNAPVGSAIIVGRGPSLFKNKHPEMLAEAIQNGEYKGLVISSDGGLVPLLDAGVIPDAVVSVDGSPVIKKYFEHPLLAEHGHKIKWITTVTVSPEVYRQARKNNIPIFWFNPMFDDWRQNESWTRLQVLMTRTDKYTRGIPRAMSGGCAGNCAWIMAMEIFKRSPIALVGMDAGYPEGTKLEDTQYYSSVLKIAKGNTAVIKEAYKEFYHPVFKCYDPETELLTISGWKHISEVTIDDAVITLNPENNTIEYQHPISLIIQKYKGKMYRLENQCIDLLVTPNHQMFVAPYKRYIAGKRGPWEFRTAINCYGKHLFYKRDGVWIGLHQEHFYFPSVFWLASGSGKKKWKNHKIVPPLKVKMNEWLQFFGFWLAEGCCLLVPEDKHQLYRFKITNTNKNLLDAMQKNLETIGLRSWFTIVKKTPPIAYDLNIQNKQIYNYLIQFGKADKKYIPSELKNLCKDQLQILFSWYMKGDGHIDKNGVQSGYTTSQRLADDLQEIALKIGIVATIRKYKQYIGNINGRPIVPRHTGYTLIFSSVKKNPRVYVKRSNWERKNHDVKFTEEWVDYDGDVFCVEVPKYHILYVRRNGKPVWCGNSKAYADLVFYHYRQSFIEMNQATDAWYRLYGGTISCTEGGTLFGQNIKCMRFQDFLKEHPK